MNVFEEKAQSAAYSGQLRSHSVQSELISQTAKVPKYQFSWKINKQEMKEYLYLMVPQREVWSGEWKRGTKSTYIICITVNCGKRRKISGNTGKKLQSARETDTLNNKNLYTVYISSTYQYSKYVKIYKKKKKKICFNNNKKNYVVIKTVVIVHHHDVMIAQMYIKL